MEIEIRIGQGLIVTMWNGCDNLIINFFMGGGLDLSSV